MRNVLYMYLANVYMHFTKCVILTVLYLRLTGTVHVHRYSVHVHGLQMSVIQDLTIIPYYKHHRYIDPVLSLGAKSVDDRRARTRE